MSASPEASTTAFASITPRPLLFSTITPRIRRRPADSGVETTPAQRVSYQMATPESIMSCSRAMMQEAALYSR